MDKARSRRDELEMQESLNKEYMRRDEQIAQRLRDIGFMYYRGTDIRRRQEIADGNMVQEDGHAMANLSRQAIHTEYPKYKWFSNPFFTDGDKY